jgi:pyruvate dehydrogenase E1 component
VGDAIWAAADQRARGFLLGATSGRTTLGGEGLQHQDGSSHLVAATIPNCKAWDPAHAGELAVILDAGMREMLIEQRDVFYYITLMNENYAQPDLPEGAAEGVLRGAYVFARLGDAGMAKSHVTLLGSGAILTEVLKAATQLASEGVAATVVSVTSWSELARDGVACEQRMLAGEAAGKPWIAQLLDGTQGPVVAATDYVRAVPEAVRAFLPTGRRFLTLGTDGFGRSDTRAALRGYFGVDARSVAQAARRLVQAG